MREGRGPLRTRLKDNHCRVVVMADSNNDSVRERYEYAGRKIVRDKRVERSLRSRKVVSKCQIISGKSWKYRERERERRGAF